MPTLLEIRDLTVRYFKDSRHLLTAVNKVALRVEQGETLGIVGESGCGKTTLALATTKLLPQNARIDDGEVVFEGRDILKMSDKELTRIRGGKISYIFQEPSSCLNPVLTVANQLIEAIRLHNAKLKKQYLYIRAEELLSQVGMKDADIKLRSYPHQLSGGENQRVMIAMAIAATPSMLILDEPTSALDISVQAKIVQTLEVLKKEMNLTMLLITHDLRLAKQVCSRLLVMREGSIVPSEGNYAKKLFDSIIRCPYLQSKI